MGKKDKVTRIWKVYGPKGCYQAKSYFPSGGTANCFGDYIEVINADKTGTTKYSIMKITSKSEDDCETCLHLQLWEGFYSNTIVGCVEEITEEELEDILSKGNVINRDKSQKCNNEKIVPVTKIWRVYGAEGHRQRISFFDSWGYDFSKGDKTRIIEVFNSDKTGTNEYSIIKITKNSEEECEKEFNGQLWDGIFENSRVGDFEKITEEEFNEIVSDDNLETTRLII